MCGVSVYIVNVISNTIVKGCVVADSVTNNPNNSYDIWDLV